jgi:uncharacterized protein DUF4337
MSSVNQCEHTWEEIMPAPEHIDPSNRKVALIIAVLAVLLAFVETLGRDAQTEGLRANIEAANLWAFFQAKTARVTTLRTAAEAAELELVNAGTEGKAAIAKRIDEWRKTAARYDSEPETREGRKELSERAKGAEAERDRALVAYHRYEMGSAALQIAIVLASAHVITGAAFLLWGCIGLGIAGLIFGLIGLLAPVALHLH